MARMLALQSALAALALAVASAPASAPRAVGATTVPPASAQLLARRTSTLSAQGLRALATQSWWGGTYTASTGEPVTVYVSDSYPRDDAVGRRWADLFAALLHGSELGALTAYVAPLEVVESECGDGTLGCYGGNRLVTIGEPVDGVTAEEVATHEYGHHVAAHSSNAPWRATEWGTKRWASRIGVCARAAAGTAYPGDEGIHYRFNPGEAFAETYRVLNETRSGATTFTWQIVDRSFYPDEGALTSLEADISEPWTAPVRATARARFRAHGPRLWSTRLRTPLDGDLFVRLRLPAGAGYDLTLTATGGKTLATGLWARSGVKELRYRVCGRRSFVLRVRRHGSPGRFTVETSRP